MTFRQAVGVVLLAIAGQAGVQQVGGPVVQPAAPPTPVAAVAPPTHQNSWMTRNIPDPVPAAVERPPVVAPSVEWYTAAARREYDRTHSR